MGSPPRMRGKLAPKTKKRHCQRITPADAGKTERDPPRHRSEEDHPRGCGENP